MTYNELGPRGVSEAYWAMFVFKALKHKGWVSGQYNERLVSMCCDIGRCIAAEVHLDCAEEIQAGYCANVLDKPKPRRSWRGLMDRLTWGYWR